MITTVTMPTAEFNDADLVADSLKGNREAFRQIVERYQTLISSLGYCATGNVALSEDLAQETFVTAWQKLADLREPAKLRAWLCGINRFLVSKEFRRLGREPIHAAESLEAVDEWTSPEPLPLDHVISDEEKAILWRAIQRIPEIYREPLVLYYREHQSIEAVAQSLDLTEDAVKQRLSRGRKLLQQSVLGFVEAALERTKPDKAFALGVLAALPLATTTVKAAAAGVAIKGGSSVKAAASFAMLGAVLTAGALFTVSLFGFFAFTGACVGYMMNRACKRSARDLQHVIACWRTLAIAFLAIAAPALVASMVIPQPAWCHTYSGVATLWLRLLYPAVLVALIIWIGRWWQGLRHGEADKSSFDELLKKRFAIWLALGLLVPALFGGEFLCGAVFSATWSSQRLDANQAQQMLGSRKDAEVFLKEYASGTKELTIRLPESRRRVAYFTEADAATLAALAGSGITYKTLVEGHDFVDTGLTWHALILLSVFVAAMGGMVIAGHPWQQRFFVRQEAEVRQDERAARNAFKALAVSVALVMLAVGVALCLITRWNVRSLSAVEVQRMVDELKGAQFEVYQYSNGTKELWISHQRHPDFIASATPVTLSILADKEIHYKTYVQGRDFGFGAPRPWAAFFWICLLGGGAVIILWSVSPKIIAVIVASVMLFLCIMMVFMAPWHASTISAEAGRAMILEHPADRFEVTEYSSGARELSIFSHGSGHSYIARADDSTLALLAEKKIAFQTSVQGRDFGYGVPTRRIAGLWILLFAGIGGFVVWLAWRKKATPDRITAGA
jgi:RNA polymerase sigma factor (sigma-70 family)